MLAPELAVGWTLAVGAADLDGDLLPEVYLAQDFGPDRLLHNRSRPGELRLVPLHGRRTFTTPRSLAIGGDSFNGMGVDFGDLNGDGRPDIVVSNTTCDFGIHESNFVFLSERPSGEMAAGIAPYRDASERLGLARGGWTWDVRLADFDNDSVPEMIQAAGFTRGSVNRWPELHELSLGNDGLMADPRFYHPIATGDDVAGRDHNPFFVRDATGATTTCRHASGWRRRASAAGSPSRTSTATAGSISPWRTSGDGPTSSTTSPRPTAPSWGCTSSCRQGRGKAPLGRRSAQSATVHLPDGRRLVAQVDGGNGHSGQRPPTFISGWDISRRPGR